MPRKSIKWQVCSLPINTPVWLKHIHTHKYACYGDCIRLLHVAHITQTWLDDAAGIGSKYPVVEYTVGRSSEMQDGLATRRGESEVVYAISSIQTDQSKWWPRPLHHSVSVEEEDVGVFVVCGKYTLEGICLWEEKRERKYEGNINRLQALWTRHLAVRYRTTQHQTTSTSCTTPLITM